MDQCNRIGFVMQDDVAFPHLTVKETLTYAALLRLPNTLTKDQKRDRAMEVITDLALERYIKFNKHYISIYHFLNLAKHGILGAKIL